MDPLVGAGIGAGLNILGAVIGELWAAGDRQTAENLLKDAAAQYNIPLPELQKMVAPQIKSAFEDAATDPALREAQMGALTKLKAIEDAGGLTLEDKAALNKIQGQTGRQATARQSAIREDMAERGIGGSGAELAMSQANAQAEAQRASEAGLDVAAQAQKRYFDSILRRGQMAGDIRGQDWGEARDKAAARDHIAQYNADALSRTHQYNQGLNQQQWGNRMDLADKKSRGQYAMAGYYQGQGDRKAQIASSTGKGLGKAVNAFGEDEDE